MPIALDNTLATATANSYVDVTFADDYWANHWSAVKAAQWAALTTQQKTALLIQSCAVLEQIRFTVPVRLLDSYPLLYDRRSHTVLQISSVVPPVKWYYYQRLQFPRNIDRDVVSGVLFIPQEVQEAQCEQSVYMLNFDDSVLSNQLQGIEVDIASVGGIHVRQNYSGKGNMVSPMAVEFLKKFMIRTNAVTRRA